MVMAPKLMWLTLLLFTLICDNIILSVESSDDKVNLAIKFNDRIRRYSTSTDYIDQHPHIVQSTDTMNDYNNYDEQLSEFEIEQNMRDNIFSQSPSESLVTAKLLNFGDRILPTIQSSPKHIAMEKRSQTRDIVSNRFSDDTKVPKITSRNKITAGGNFREKYSTSTTMVDSDPPILYLTIT